MVQHAEKGGLYRSDDGGEKWTLVNGSHSITQRGWYYSRIFADPRNADTIYVTNVNFLKSIDGGKTFSRIKVRHGDTHDLWIDPADTQRMILGDDGGAEITFNGGQTWTTQDNQPTAEIYRVVADDRFPFWVYSGQQDNTTVAIPTGVRDERHHPEALARRGRRRVGLDRARPAQPRHRLRGELRRVDHALRPQDRRDARNHRRGRRSWTDRPSAT